MRIARRAFTLVEVTISVALALVLMLGVAQVFRVTGDAVGTGQALAGALQNSRAAQNQLSRDLGSAVRDGSPYFIILNYDTYAFRNRADMLGDKDQDPSTADLTGVGTESTIAATSYGNRVHRTDSFNFFARGFFQRQTGGSVGSGGASPFIAPMSSPEAWLWYGQMKLPDGSGNFPSGGLTSPGKAPLSTNPNNYFADDWILGREQVLLKLRTTVNNAGVTIPAAIIDNNGSTQFAYAPTSTLSPMVAGSTAYSTVDNSTKMVPLSGSGSFQIESSRLDIAETSIASYYNTLSSYIPAGVYPPPNQNLRTWYTNFFASDTNRFQVTPVLGSRPITPENLALSAPVLVKACTQFIVEYAGDYLNQDANGNITDTYVHLTEDTSSPPKITALSTGSTDGQIDYFVSTTGGVSTRKIRWYGMPRSTAGKATISAANGDVVPLRDVWPNSLNGSQAPFEKTLPTATVPVDYSSGSGAMTTSASTPARYLCVWGPTDPKPKMIRITMVIDDPQGRLGDGQTYEYIFTLP